MKNINKFNFSNIRKVIIVMLIITISLSGIAMYSGCDSDREEFSFFFLTDLHIIDDSDYVEEDFVNNLNVGKMNVFTKAIFYSVVDDIIKSGIKYVLVGGDICDDGADEAREAALVGFNKLLDNGVKVFLVNGNHDALEKNRRDLQDERIATFKEVFKDCGYSDAIATFEGTTSYIADMDSRYRIFALDNKPNHFADGYKEPMSDEHIEWVRQQLLQCKKDKKTPIVILHEGLVVHFPNIAGITFDLDTANQYLKLAETLADNGAYYVFSGHYHLQDIKTYTSAKDNVLYDIQTSSLSYYPINYRKAVFTRKHVYIESIAVDYVNPQYISDKCPEEIKDELNNMGLQAFAERALTNELTSNMDFGKANGALSSINVQGNLKKFLDIASREVLDKAFNNPFFIEDEDDNISLERILNAYDIEIPPATCKNMTEVIIMLFKGFMGGDENFVDSLDIDILPYVVYSFAYYMNESYDLFIDEINDYDIWFDLEEIFKEDKLNCYDSGLVPTLLNTLQGSGLSDIIAILINSAIKNNLNNVTILNPVIAELTRGIVTTLDPYHDNKNIFLDLLASDFFIIVAHDVILDIPPADNDLVIVRKR